MFVLMEYANKLIEDYSLEILKQLFNVAESEVATWYLPNAH
jgi:hypothetical protein